MQTGTLDRCPALVSIHDVMPHTLHEVAELVAGCRQRGIDKLTLLVVPGLDWTTEQLTQVRQWQLAGCVLAGHGWTHRCESIRTTYHWLHSRLLSRNVAEHLSLTEDQVVALVQRCGQWFDEHGFAIPYLYVPPAWAVGRLFSPRMADLPFEMLETLSGVTWLRSGAQRGLPLVGFEADTATRRIFLGYWNRWTIRNARRRCRTLRISLHPFDHRLLLADSLWNTLSLGWRCLSYDELLL